jgi:hypothetical protein
MEFQGDWATNHPRFKALGRVPVLSSIVHTLQEKENRAMRSAFFLGIWDDYFPLCIDEVCSSAT